MIKPTIGRRVWFWPDRKSSASGFSYSDQSQPLDAGIAYVHSDRLINISAADQNGNMHSFCSVLLCQEGDERPEHGRYCEWMPYQVGQAKAAGT